MINQILKYLSANYNYRRGKILFQSIGIADFRVITLCILKVEVLPISPSKSKFSQFHPSAVRKTSFDIRFDLMEFMKYNYHEKSSIRQLMNTWCPKVLQPTVNNNYYYRSLINGQPSKNTIT